MREWFSDGKRALATAMVIAVVVGAWMFRYEILSPGMHRNRLTGNVCSIHQSCWLCSGFDECSK
jgi:hypothetical protein